MADFYAKNTKRLFKPKDSCQQKSCLLYYKEEELLVRQIKQNLTESQFLRQMKILMLIPTYFAIVAQTLVTKICNKGRIFKNVTLNSKITLASFAALQYPQKRFSNHHILKNMSIDIDAGRYWPTTEAHQALE